MDILTRKSASGSETPSPEQTAALLALVSLEGISKTDIRALLDDGLSPADILNSRMLRWFGRQKPFLTMVDRVKQDVDLRECLDKLQEWKRKGYEVVTVLDPLYPHNLRNVASAPLVLWYRGESRPTDDHSVAVVGTREASREGLVRASRMAEGLANAGVVVMSGLARGIDTAAHTATLNAGGRTIAVMGTGLDTIYPPENKSLAERIVQNGGALVSQFPPEAPVQRWRFPLRNRTMSGMVQGTVVIEASISSGARLQAEYAIEQGRRLFLLRSLVKTFRWAKQAAAYYGSAIIVDDVSDVLKHLQAAE